jgi:hypothetical protein
MLLPPSEGKERLTGETPSVQNCALSALKDWRIIRVMNIAFF